MDTNKNQSPVYTNEDKLQYEVQKLKEDIKSLQKPFYTTPTFWISSGTLLISVFTFIFQNKLNEIKNQDIKKENKELVTKNDLLKKDSIRLITAKKNIEKEINEKQKYYAEVSQKVANFNIKTDGKYENEIVDIQKSIQKTKISFSVNKTPNTDNAKKFEAEGFQYLSKNDFDNAILSFTKSENATNGYHVSYDIAKLILDDKNAMKGDLEAQKELLKTIITKFGGYIPKEYMSEIKRQSEN